METANEVEIESEEWATVAKKKGKIGKTKKNRSPGEDGIPYEMIQKLHESAMKVLLKIYNGSLPKDWKHAIILPILKPAKDPTKPESYRPISLTSCLCKIMERMITNRLQWFVERKNLLTKDQAGFRKHRSTIDQVIRLQGKISKSLKGKHHVLGIFIDFEKAYDMIHLRQIRLPSAADSFCTPLSDL